MKEYKSQQVGLIVCTQIRSAGIDAHSYCFPPFTRRLIIHYNLPDDVSYMYGTGISRTEPLRDTIVSLVSPQDMGSLQHLQDFWSNEKEEGSASIAMNICTFDSHWLY